MLSAAVSVPVGKTLTGTGASGALLPEPAGAIALRAWRGLWPFLWDLLWSNIGTYLLLLIYYVRRDRMRQACKKDELEQMNRQDLE